MAKRKKIKKKVKYSFIILVLIIAASIFGINKYKEYKYHQTNLYKLTVVGYSLDNAKTIVNKLNNDNELYFVNNEKNDYIVDIIKEKYFLEKNLYEYIEYKSKNKKKSYSDVIAIVNVRANKDWYDNKVVRETDLSKGNLILVNKFNYLNNSFIPNEIVDVDINYAYQNNKASKEVNDAYVLMAKDAKKDNIILLVNSSYRTYERQEEIYKEFYYSKGISYADKYAARAGYSEHQTGLALDIFTSGRSTTSDFDQSEAFKWLTNNAHKYGFILRYPKDKEYLTGYSYESWHYRYLGVDTATKVYNSGLTYDEYYAYYLDK